MKQTRKKILIWSVIILVGASIAAGIWWFSRTVVQGAKVKISKSKPQKLPAMTIKGFSLEQTDGDKLEWILNAKQAYMYGIPNNQMAFDDVNALVYGSSGIKGSTKQEVYTVTAVSGTYYTKQDKVDLDGNVVVGTSDGYSFYTDSANYDIAKRKISTDDPVYAKGESKKSGALYVEGEGLEGNTELGEFLLSGSVLAKLGTKLDVKSKKATFNTKKETVVFDGGVSARKEKLNITGKKMSLGYDKNGEISDMEVLGNVAINVDNKKALCDNAVIRGSSSEVVLTGRPEFHSGKDIIVGEKIVFFTDSDEVYVSKVKASVSGKGAGGKK